MIQQVAALISDSASHSAFYEIICAFVAVVVVGVVSVVITGSLSMLTQSIKNAAGY